MQTQIDLLLFFAANNIARLSPKKKSLSDITPEEITQIVLVLCILAVLIATAFYFISKIKSTKEIETPESADTLLIRYQEMFEKGELSKEEYRKIKDLLAHELTGQETIIKKSSQTEKQKKADEREERLRQLLGELDRKK